MKKILIVDDEVSLTRLMAMNLEDTGDFEIRIENESFNATKVAKLFNPDVVIMDILMPGKSGLKIIGDWQKEETLSQIPVIFLTAAMSKHQPTVEEGFLDKYPVLIKPVSFEELLEKIEDVTAK